VIETGQTGYTHEVCGACGKLLYCSEAEPWDPQQDHGWCTHDEIGRVAVWTNPPGPDSWHRCLSLSAPQGAQR